MKMLGLSQIQLSLEQFERTLINLEHMGKIWVRGIFSANINFAHVSDHFQHFFKFDLFDLCDPSDTHH